MEQNRNNLIKKFVGNISNAILHRILEKAIDNSEISSRYEKEMTTSSDIAKKYREKINPVNRPLPKIDATDIKDSIMKKVKTELLIRTSKGYKN